MHSHHHTHKQGEENHGTNKFLRPGLHKDWRTWVVLGLMLAAISIYVVTLDDAVQPDSAPQKEVPAAAVPR
jgi:hypothetical protein